MPTLEALHPGRVSLVDDYTWDADLLPEIPDQGVYLMQIDLDNGKGDGSSDRSGTADRNALFAATATSLGLGDDQPIHTWSGFQDRLWGHLAERFADRGYLVLRRSDALLGGALSDLLTAAEVFTELAAAVGGGSESFPGEMALSVVLTGVGADFPR